MFVCVKIQQNALYDNVTCKNSIFISLNQSDNKDLLILYLMHSFIFITKFYNYTII